jgi:hypothetical protein
LWQQGCTRAARCAGRQAPTPQDFHRPYPFAHTPPPAVAAAWPTGLSKTWGPLSKIESSTIKGALKLTGPPERAAPAPKQGLKVGSVTFGPGLYAALAIGSAATVSLIVAAAGFAVAAALRAGRGREADKSAQIAYTTELTEGELDGHLEEDAAAAGAEAVISTGSQKRLLMWLGGLPEPEQPAEVRGRGGLGGGEGWSPAHGGLPRTQAPPGWREAGWPMGSEGSSRPAGRRGCP